MYEHSNNNILIWLSVCPCAEEPQARSACKIVIIFSWPLYLCLCYSPAKCGRKFDILVYFFELQLSLFWIFPYILVDMIPPTLFPTYDHPNNCVHSFILFLHHIRGIPLLDKNSWTFLIIHLWPKLSMCALFFVCLWVSQQCWELAVPAALGGCQWSRELGNHQHNQEVHKVYLRHLQQHRSKVYDGRRQRLDDKNREHQSITIMEEGNITKQKIHSRTTGVFGRACARQDSGWTASII